MPNSTSRLFVSASTLAVSALLLAGCAAGAPDDPAADGTLKVVASTNVYGDLAATIGGSDVEVTSVIESPEQDPHEFEANARVQLALSEADIVIQNGGGYDDFMDTMLDAAGNDAATVLDAVELSGKDAEADGFNEHVWYDYPTMLVAVEAIAAALADADPDNAATFTANADALSAQIEGLIEQESTLAVAAAGSGVVITEPVPLYVLDALGLDNLTPAEFSEAIEEDTDVPPALLQQTLAPLEDGAAALVVYNVQTGGPQTDAILAAASDSGIPTVPVTETLPDGDTYVSWQQGVLDDLGRALTD